MCFYRALEAVLKAGSPGDRPGESSPEQFLGKQPGRRN